MPRQVRTVDALIKTLDGARAVAALTGVTVEAVYNWPRRRRRKMRQATVPAEHYDVLTKALARKDCTASPALFGMREAAE